MKDKIVKFKQLYVSLNREGLTQHTEEIIGNQTGDEILIIKGNRHLLQTDIMRPVGMNGNSHDYVGCSILYPPWEEEQAKKLVLRALYHRIEEISKSAMLLMNNLRQDMVAKKYLHLTEERY